MPLTIPLSQKQWDALNQLSQEPDWVYAQDLGVHGNILFGLGRKGYAEWRTQDGYLRTGRHVRAMWQYRITDAGRERLKLEPSSSNQT